MIISFRCTTLCMLVLTAISGFAQKKPAYQSYSWAEKPEMHSISKENVEFPAVVVQHHRMMELYIPLVGNTPATYFTEHKIIHLNSDAGIEKLNKVAIPMHNGRELIDLKVRALGSDGKVTNFRRENLKELQNVDGYRNYKIFAVEGITVGGEVEYIYTVKSTPQVYGREMIQQDIPVMEAGFVMLFPKRFEFEMKVYNKLNIPKSSSYDDNRNAITFSTNNIPALNEEEYSTYRANLIRVDYRLSKNDAQPPMTWSSLAGRLVSNTIEPNGSGSMKVTNLIKQLNIDRQSDEEKVRILERYVKTNFTLKEGNNDEYQDLKDVISNKVGNETGFLKLYTSCLRALNINFFMVFGCNRNDGKLDPYFPTPLDIREALIYFPSLDKYLTPGVSHMRLGAAPEALAESTALFVPVTVKGSDPHIFQTIKPLSYDLNTMGVKAAVVLKDGVANVVQENLWQGSRGALYRGIYNAQRDAQREDFIKNVTLSSIENFKVQDRKFEGEDLINSEDVAKFFKIKTSYISPSLVQQAGDDYLISAGKIIGRQSELYQEKERQSGVSFHGTSNYIHEITIEIPDGYKCAGLEAAKIDKKVMQGDKAVMFFQSDFKQVGNKVILTVNEVYKVLSLPKEKYEEFRGVVNSAADFSKLVLVLSKN
jgi:hypothetical protein